MSELNETNPITLEEAVGDVNSITDIDTLREITTSLMKVIEFQDIELRELKEMSEVSGSVIKNLSAIVHQSFTIMQNAGLPIATEMAEMINELKSLSSKL